MKYPMKTLIGSSVLVGAIGLTLGFSDTEARYKDLAEIQTRQADVFSTQGKYERIDERDLPKGVKVHEYVAPGNRPGYQIVWEDEFGYYSYGFGVEAEERTYTIFKEQRETELSTTTRQ